MPGRQCLPAMSGVCWTSVSGPSHWAQVRPWEGPLGLTRKPPEGAVCLMDKLRQPGTGRQQLGDGRPPWRS